MRKWPQLLINSPRELPQLLINSPSELPQLLINSMHELAQLFRSWRGARRRMWWGTTSSRNAPPASWPRPRRHRRPSVSSKVPSHANRLRGMCLHDMVNIFLSSFFHHNFFLTFAKRILFYRHLLYICKKDCIFNSFLIFCLNVLYFL
jgi:hypothetical protein